MAQKNPLNFLKFSSFSKSRETVLYVYDLENNNFLDTIMGIGPIISTTIIIQNKQAIIKQLKNGITFRTYIWK